LRLTYRYEHLFGVFGNVRGRSYLLVCEACGTPWRIPPAAAYKLGRLTGDPIPFLHRYGCLLLFLALFAAAAVSWLVESVRP
jgi:hypothetical protein